MVPLISIPLTYALPLLLIPLFLIYALPSLPRRQSPFHSHSPPLSTVSLPLLGSLQYFGKRWTFWKHQAHNSKTGNFSFWLAGWKVVGLSGKQGREWFFSSPHLDFDAGYAALFGASPQTTDVATKIEGDEIDVSRFTRRITALLKKDVLAQRLPDITSDLKFRLNKLGDSGLTDPFESIWAIIFQITMRTVGCKEVAEDHELQAKVLRLYREVESSSSMVTILFPWFPGPAKAKRVIAATRLYLIFKKVVDDRKKHGITENDPLQHLIDSGDSMLEIIEFIISSLFAGIVNSGLNAAYVLCYLSLSPEWTSKCLAEVRSVASHYSPSSTSLVEALDQIPLEAWETEFPLLDLCLKDSIRLHLQGAALRRNMTGKELRVGGGVIAEGGKGGGEEEIVPEGALVAYHLADIHYDPEIYKDPLKWDPSRYLPDREEGKGHAMPFLGWGEGRHPCLGKRFAKLEQNLLLAHFLARFDFTVAHADGSPRAAMPPLSMENHEACKPKEQVFLKYQKVARGLEKDEKEV